MLNKQIIKVRFVFLFIMGLTFMVFPILQANAFVVQNEFSENNNPGFVIGTWHGLLAPYSLIARWVNHDIEMYAMINTGWLYDAGFLIGSTGSIPFGWVAAIISSIAHIST